ncbi:E3 ubiquitin-protein ligase UBR1 [Thelohanellus kitauei]|uniref:E3 ubiquitin-protein ligase n=1 Tax=Thelohanellus kitauei TaxID=669202 RepID=A0A0C2JPN3_THEKT|nr:E3 ubiquitin-protein ligase UBR1 [Thelohanellus kitauei]
MEDIKSRLDSIIINGLLVTSNDTEIDVSQVYGKNKLMKLVGVPLENYIFEGCDLDFKQWFQSKECNLEACTKVLTPYSFIYTCLDCRVNEIGHACEDCFRRSVHFYHEHELRCYDSIYKTCDCGHLDAWKSHPTCPKHIKAERSEGVLPEPFISKLTYIIQYLCQLFEEICTENDSIFDNHMENMLETYLRAKCSNLIPNQEKSSLNAEIDANCRKSCLLIPYDDTFDLDEFIDCLKIIREISGEGGYVDTNDMNEQGYAWVLYLSDVEKCKKSQRINREI